MGYHMAGFDVRGIDIEPQPNYPFRFRQADALRINPKWIRKHFDAVVASPPCLGYTTLAALHPHIRHAKLIPATRDLLDATGLPYIIENVQNAKNEMISPIRLCGSSFGLRVQRHRLFEISGFDVPEPPGCQHEWQNRDKRYKIHMSRGRGSYRRAGIVAVYGSGQQMIPPKTHSWEGWNLHVGSVAMGIDWMTRLELNQAIPPVYTYWLGSKLMRALS